MCLAVPSKIVEIQDSLAIIDVEGVRKKISLMLLEDAQIGDFVIVHAGFAIRKLDEQAAKESLDFLRQAINFADSQND